jgi:amino acid adenylation domain-containing protein
MAAYGDHPVAIVGIGCRFPGGADGPDAFWSTLLQGKDAIGEAPERVGLGALHDPTPLTPGKVACTQGGFLEGIELFDARFFEIAPVEAARMDPQQRLALSIAWEALEDAGIVPARLRGTATGIFLGVSYDDYSNRIIHDVVAVDPYVVTGGCRAIVAGRVSYFFDFRGPSLTIDTACSSSLAAVHLACRSLRDGECPVALAGGVSILMRPEFHVGLSRGGMLARDGRCKSFDARGDGFVRSEGAGMIVLKCLDRALADGDRIYGVIRGSATNSDGRTSGLLLTPGQGGQEEVIEAACRSAGIEAGRIGYVEAHGTGTRAGDPVELGALAAVIGARRGDRPPVRVGSVKTNIGHTEPAAGIAGLIKTALALHHRVVPASLHFEEGNPSIPWDRIPFEVQREAGPFLDEEPVASVNSFGLGGQNAHVIVEAAPRAAKATGTATTTATAGRAHLLPISAHTEASLRALVGRLADRLGEADPPGLADLCHTGALCRTHHERRLAVMAESPASLREALRAFLAEGSHPDVVSGTCLRTRPRMVFVFPGQGAQWAGMGRSLYATEPAFRATIDAIDQELQAFADWSLVDELHRDEARSRLDRLDVVQPTIFAVQLGLASLWRAFGVVPDATVGHSMGEAAAACVAGALSIRDALRIVSVRTQLINELAPRGSMAAVELSEAAAEEALGPWRDRASIAVVNSPSSVVVSGETEAIDALLASLAARDVFARKVRVDCASHSKYMENVLPRLGLELRSMEPREGGAAFYSTVEGRRLDGASLGADYWCQNLRRPVRMKEAVERLAADGYTLFLELSHHPLLASAVRATLDAAGKPGTILTSLRRDEPERPCLLRTAGALWAEGHPLAWAELAAEPGRFTAWPMYPWDPQRYWLDEVVSEARIQATRGAGSGHPLLGHATTSSLDAAVRFWTGRVDPAALPLLGDHRVGGEPILPTTAYVEMLLAAARAEGSIDRPVISDLAIEAATVFAGGKPVELQLALVRRGEALEARISASDAGTWRARARCAIKGVIARDGDVAPPPADLEAIRDRCADRRTGAEHYAGMERRGLAYGPRFRGVAEIWRRDGEALGAIQSPAQAPWTGGGFVVHPALLDACLQVAVAAMIDNGDTAAVLPVAIERLRVLGDCGAVRWSHATVDGDPADPAALRVDVTLLDAEGRALAEARGLRVRRLEVGSAAGPRGDDEGRLFQLSFQEVAQDPPASGPPGVWIALADRTGVGIELARRIRAAGGRCLAAVAGDRWKEIEPDLFCIDPEDAASYARLLDAAQAVRGIVHLWSLDLDDPARAARCFSLVPLLQTLGEHRDRLRLVLVTRGAQAVPGVLREITPVQATMVGLGRVIAQEHPELDCRRIDLDPAGDGASVLLAELLSTGAEDEIVLRDGARLAPRLERFTPTSGRLRRAGSRAYALIDGAMREVPRRAPGRGEVEIAVRSAALDGSGCAGAISALGAGVRGLDVGDRVVAVGPGDLAARYAIVDARLAWRALADLPDAQAAVQPGAWLAAACALGRLAPGDRVRVAGDGGVADAAEQLARRAGAEVCAAGEPVDLVVETRPGAGRGEAASLSAGGRWVTVGAETGPSAPPGPNRAWMGVDLRALLAEAPARARSLLGPALDALDHRALAPVSSTAVAIPGAAQPILPPAGARARRAGGTWLITGGLGGLGRTLAAHLVEALGAKGLVLVGRRAPPDANAFAARLEAAGAIVRVEALDVADPDAVAALFARVLGDPELPPLSGVVHAAGVLEDGIVVRQDRARFERVLAPKVLGAWNLHTATRDLDIDHFVLFSSAAALLGSPGQGSYAAGNAFLDALAWARARDGLPALSIAWGAWAELGLAARADSGGRLAERGMKSFAPAEGAALFERLLDTEAIQVAAMAFDATRWGERDGRRAPFFERLQGGAAAGGEILDREALLALAPGARCEAITGFVRAEVAAIMRLSPEQIHPEDPLQRLGLDSLMAVEIRGRVERRLGVTVPVLRILQGISPLELARFVDEQLRAPEAPREEAITPDLEHRHDPFPLTEIQQAYLIGRSGFAYGDVACHTYLELETEAARLDAIEDAWNRLVAHHDMLRAVVLPDGSQRALPEVPRYRFARADLGALPAGEMEAALLATREEMSNQKLSVERWPLFDIRVSLLPAGALRLHVDIDLLLSDAAGLFGLLLDWSRLAERPGAPLDHVGGAPLGVPRSGPGGPAPPAPAPPNPLDPIGVSFRDLALAEQRRREGEAYQRSLAYWRGRLADLAPAPDLPVTSFRARPTFARRSSSLGPERWAKLQARAREAGCTPAAVLGAAFAEAVGTWCRSRRFTLNLTLFERPRVHPDAARVLGESTSTLLLTVDLGGRDFTARARAFQERLATDLEHAAVSGLRVMRELGRDHHAGEMRFFPVVFTSLIGRTRGSEAHDFIQASLGRRVFSMSSTAQTFIDHQIYEDAGGLEANWDFMVGVLPPGVGEAMVQAWEAQLGSLADDPEAWLRGPSRHVPALELAARAEVNATEHPLPEGPLHGPFLARAARDPDRPAVITAARTLSYGELLGRSLRVAATLREGGARPGSLVAVHMQRGWEQIVAVIGVLLAGAAYLPVDAALPPERALHLVARSEASLCLTQSAVPVPEAWPEGVRRIAVDLLGEDADQARALPPAPAPAPTDLAYVIFTSGSTGEPKGVMIDHRGARNTVADVNERFDVGPDDRVLAVSSLSFDLSVYDVFGLLGAGGAVVLPDPDRGQDPAHWAELCDRHRVTVWNSVPALAEMLVEHAGSSPLPGRLRLVLMSGDWIPVPLPDRIRALAPSARVVALGGATEASIWSILHEIEQVDPAWTSIPYGRPMRNQRFRVLDAAMEPCPVGVPGELHIGGVGLALGYLGDPARTGASFVHAPDGERLYRTGDLGRYLPSGEIELLGREDQQVKIRGHRVELGEIEAALARHPGVAASAVIAHGDARGHRRLVAYVVPRAPDATDTESAPDPAWDALVAGARAAGAAEGVWGGGSCGSGPAGTAAGDPQRSPPIVTGDTRAAALAPMFDEMNARTLGICAAALQRLGLFTGPEPATVDALLARGGILPRYRAWLVRVLEGLAAAGLVRREGDAWRAGRALENDGGRVLAATGDPRLDRTLAVLDRARARLPEVLTGAVPAVELLFEGDSVEEAEHLYEDWFEAANATARAAVRALVAQRGSGALRVIEIGAGVGSTTEHLLPELPAERTDYLYTDISPWFFEGARRRFARFPSLRFARLDIEQSPAEQGLEPHGFDLVVASSVLHATRAIAATLAHVRALLAPGGLLLMLEETSFHPSFNLTMGLQQGFDRFEDAPLRTRHPLLDGAAWEAALRAAGFADVAVFSSPGSASDLLGVRVLAARGPAKVGPTAEALRRHLAASLPAYMVPGALLFLDALPLSANGKVDRRRLPDPAEAQRAAEAGHVTPRDEREALIAGVWREVLSAPRVGVHDNFFDLGGDSLLLVRVQNRLVAALGRPIPIVELFEHPTVAALAKHLSPGASEGVSLRAEAERRAAAQAAARQERRRRRGPGE